MTGKRMVALVMILSSLSLHAAGQCEGPEYEGFDFWVGDWTISQKFRAGEDEWIALPAKTSVSRILDGCALLERWEGQVQYPWQQMDEPRKMEGLSLRYFLPSEGVWRIQWMDSMNPFLADGHFGSIENGKGEFVPRPKPEGGRWSKIVFERKSEDHVYWHLDFTSDDGETWRTIWIMDMKR